MFIFNKRIPTGFSTLRVYTPFVSITKNIRCIPKQAYRINSMINSMEKESRQETINVFTFLYWSMVFKFTSKFRLRCVVILNGQSILTIYSSMKTYNYKMTILSPTIIPCTFIKNMTVVNKMTAKQTGDYAKININTIENNDAQFIAPSTCKTLNNCYVEECILNETSSKKCSFQHPPWSCIRFDMYRMH